MLVICRRRRCRVVSAGHSVVCLDPLSPPPPPPHLTWLAFVFVPHQLTVTYIFSVVIDCRLSSMLQCLTMPAVHRLHRRLPSRHLPPTSLVAVIVSSLVDILKAASRAFLLAPFHLQLSVVWLSGKADI